MTDMIEYNEEQFGESRRSCKHVIKTLVNKYTGKAMLDIHGEPKELNKNNNCPHFKKRLFAKKKEKVFCVDCAKFKWW